MASGLIRSGYKYQNKISSEIFLTSFARDDLVLLFNTILVFF